MSKPMDPIKKQQQDQTNEPPKKGRKSESPDEPDEMTNITDVNDFCLEHIFKYLSLIDLVNVVDSCKRLQNAARLAYSTKYSKDMVRLEEEKGRKISIDGKEIRIHNFSICLKVMRCFGDLITKLDFCSVRAPGLNRKPSEIYRYFIEYCADSVVDLVYRRATLKYLTKPFKKVETVHFTTDFRCELAILNRCFPNLRAFAMHDLNAVDRVMGHIPNLELLDICVSGKQQDKLATALRLNPQVKRLRIFGTDLDVKFLQILSECSLLESLQFFIKGDFTVASRNDPIHFKSVRKFVVTASNLQKLDVAKIAITFGQLHELTITVSEKIKENVFHLISNNPTISKLTYWNLTNYYDEETMLRIAEALPSVMELRFGWTNFSADNVMTFMKKCPLLKYIRCRITDRTECNKLKYMMGAEWRSSVDKYDYIQLQR